VLRALASALDNTSLHDLHRRAEGDTWVGPTPSRCHDTLISMRASLRNAAAQLRTNARLLNERATQLDLTSRLAPR
jgi:hypothetical protein